MAENGTKRVLNKMTKHNINLNLFDCCCKFYSLWQSSLLDGGIKKDVAAVIADVK